ncbi:hypothetical protein QSV08_19355 [Maribacter sp. BPC-D8]|uniref:hypothetical protein n=1 Tax=Maribacter sp. BPC-D8 TaxID=3053613 RepID=UPI002B491D20|nr:hypothetical protein [Maribacter sp. BPC-D8]WRI29364.1 hypothetical protein QSV08_19355 [Maribacter sp. BPC-D8]
MKEMENNTLENLADKIMKETKIETPSIDFTSKIMSQVDVIANSDLTTYKPLISKPVWIGILAMITGILTYSFFTTSASSFSSNIDFSNLFNTRLNPSISNHLFSKTMTLSMAVFALLFAIQIPLLKKYLNKRVI